MRSDSYRCPWSPWSPWCGDGMRGWYAGTTAPSEVALWVRPWQVWYGE